MGWGGDDNWDIYIKAVGPGARPFRLTEDPAEDYAPAWSPDGRQIVFARDVPPYEKRTFYTVPSLGGDERKLIETDTLSPPFSWSPDGEWLILQEKPSADEPTRIVRLSLATLEVEPLTSPPHGSRGDVDSSLSPDGTQIAFVRGIGLAFGDRDVWVQSVDGGEARRLTFEEYSSCYGLTWTDSGREVLYSQWRGALVSRIRRVSLAGGDPQPLLGVGQDAEMATVRGDRLVYLQSAGFAWDIWRVPGPAASLPTQAPTKLIASGRDESSPAYSPDGRRIAFSSSRTGEFAVWVSDSDGSNPTQLTHLERHAGAPGWSPDGRKLAFDSIEEGDWNIYAIDADGGVPRRLTHESASDRTGVWSHDGRWIYFNSDRSGRMEIWRIPSEEGGDAEQVTRDGAGPFPEVSWDGRFLYYPRPGSGVWRVPVDGGEEAEVFRESVAPHAWTLGRSGLYVVREEVILYHRRDTYSIQYLDFETGETTELFRRDGPFSHRDLAVPPDEQSILFAESPYPDSELMLMENFR